LRNWVTMVNPDLGGPTTNSCTARPYPLDGSQSWQDFHAAA